MSRIAIIGSGFSGISAAAYLSSAGHEVHVFEKNGEPGGRARVLKTDSGFSFDMGPSWYWMPGVFERFFNDFGHKVSDFYTLKLLDPSFDIIFGREDKMSIPTDVSKLYELFESIEKGSAAKLVKFLKEAEFKYRSGMEDLVYKPAISLAEFADIRLIRASFRLQLFSSFSKHVRKYFRDPRLIALMEFPVLFLGAMPQDTPALYSLMNYAALKLGTWYPMGGFGSVIDGMVRLAEMKGARFHMNSPVEKIMVRDQKAYALRLNDEEFLSDAVIASADYEHVETRLLEKEYRNYDEKYWAGRTFAPSCLICYLGINKRIPSLAHHTLFFDEELLQHSKEIYKTPEWPAKPLFYTCCPSKTDPGVAPEGHENIFLLMPIAPGLRDSPEIREKYFRIMLERLEKQTGEQISAHIVYRKSYCIEDFMMDYNAYKGNAYGLANTLRQTAILKPGIRNRKIDNLFYAGQLTVPGPGVPPSIISGKIAAEQLARHLKSKSHEVVI